MNEKPQSREAHRREAQTACRLRSCARRRFRRGITAFPERRGEVLPHCQECTAQPAGDSPELPPGGKPGNGRTVSVLRGVAVMEATAEPFPVLRSHTRSALPSGVLRDQRDRMGTMQSERSVPSDTDISAPPALSADTIVCTPSLRSPVSREQLVLEYSGCESPAVPPCLDTGGSAAAEDVRSACGGNGESIRDHGADLPAEKVLNPRQQKAPSGERDRLRGNRRSSRRTATASGAFSKTGQGAQPGRPSSLQKTGTVTWDLPGQTSFRHHGRGRQSPDQSRGCRGDDCELLSHSPAGTGDPTTCRFRACARQQKAHREGRWPQGHTGYQWS